MGEWDWMSWAEDVSQVEPKKKGAWLIVPVSFVILVAAVVAVVLLSLVLPRWALWISGFVIALACLAVEDLLVRRLLPDRIRRSR